MPRNKLSATQARSRLGGHQHPTGVFQAEFVIYRLAEFACTQDNAQWSGPSCRSRMKPAGFSARQHKSRGHSGSSDHLRLTPAHQPIPENLLFRRPRSYLADLLGGRLPHRWWQPPQSTHRRRVSPTREPERYGCAFPCQQGQQSRNDLRGPENLPS
jgi:hypothetical protein